MSTRPTALWAAIVLLVLTVIQLAVGAFGGFDQFDGKGFGYRLAVYPVLMLLVPAIWWWKQSPRPVDALPWTRSR
ncbi:hypothetical protein [Aeromicrobium sp. UC242_57]|uniref:hypothetical protein n=1 Tax=Aeromicrobium sp. UC242_57 TaxID=3374624 RepID=UPI0037A483EC